MAEKPYIHVDTVLVDAKALATAEAAYQKHGIQGIVVWCGALRDEVSKRERDGTLNLPNMEAALRQAVPLVIVGMRHFVKEYGSFKAARTAPEFNFLVGTSFLGFLPSVMPDPRGVELSGMSVDHLINSRAAHQGQAYDSALINLNAHLTYHIGAFLHHGRRLYEVTQGLGEHLLHTELRGLHGRDVHLPFPAVYLIVPDVGLRVYNVATGWHRLIGVYLLEEQHGDYRHLRILLCGEGRWVEQAGFRQFDDAVAYWSIRLYEDLSLAECIQKSTQDAIDEAPAKKLPRAFEEMEQEWNAIMQWLVNVILYATSQDVRSEVRYLDPRYGQLWGRQYKHTSPKKRKRVADQLVKLDNRRVVTLGVDVPRWDADGAQSGTGAKLLVRTLVTGHHRMVPHGPGRSERRRQWIKPFWRGPGDGPLSNPGHKLR